VLQIFCSIEFNGQLSISTGIKSLFVFRSFCTFAVSDLSSSADTTLAQSAKNVKECTAQIHEFVLSQLNAAISCKLLQLIDVYNDSYTGQY
jgi:hypothetical protein